jgi:hypothetical protein
MAHHQNLSSPSLLLLDLLMVHDLLLRILKAKDLLEFGLKLAPPTLLLPRGEVWCLLLCLMVSLYLSPCISSCCCWIPGLLMLLDL